GRARGPGAAVAGGLCLGRLGSDRGGSIRVPSAWCGIVGLKPTYGRVSRAGAMPLSWSNDHIGPMTRTVRDTALMLGVIAGRDPRDATSTHRAMPDYVAALDAAIAGVRIVVPENFFFQGIDAEITAGVREALRVLEAPGASVIETKNPAPPPLNHVCNVISRCEGAAVHARLYRERPQDLGPVVRARLELGFRISAHDYLQAQRLRARLTRGFIRDVFADADVLVAPVIPMPAPPVSH